MSSSLPESMAPLLKNKLGNRGKFFDMMKYYNNDSVSGTIDTLYMDGLTFFQACHRGAVTTAIAFLLGGMDPNALDVDGAGFGGLHYAVSVDDITLASVLIDCGARINLPSAGSGRMTPLMVALDVGATECVRMLLSRGADLLEQDAAGDPAIFYAAHQPWTLHIIATFAGHITPLSKSQAGDTPETDQERERREKHRTEEEKLIVKRLANFPAMKTITNAKGQTLLHRACQQRDAKERWPVLYLIEEAGIDPNVADADGETPLFVSVRNQEYEPCAALIAKGAEVRGAVNRAGETLVSIPCKNARVNALMQGAATAANQAAVDRLVQEDYSNWPNLLKRESIVQLLGPMLLPNTLLVLGALHLPTFFGLLVLVATGAGFAQVASLSMSQKNRCFYTCGWFSGALFYGSVILVSNVFPSLERHEPTAGPILVRTWWVVTVAMFFYYCNAVIRDPGVVRGTREMRRRVYDALVENGETAIELESIDMTSMIKKPFRSKHCTKTHRSVARFDHYCLAKTDMELLTDAGWLNYVEAEAAWRRGSLVVAGYNQEAKQLVYEKPTHFIDKEDVPDGMYEIHTDVSPLAAGEKHHDEQHISLLVSGEHQLLIQDSSFCNSEKSNAVLKTSKVKVADLLRGTWEGKLHAKALDNGSDIRLLSCVSTSALADTPESLLTAAVMNDLIPALAGASDGARRQHDDDDDNADPAPLLDDLLMKFCFLYGFWLGNGGTLDGRSPCVQFAQDKQKDINVIIECLNVFGLKKGAKREAEDDAELGDFTEEDARPNGGQYYFRIHRRSWVELFFAEYGWKYTTFHNNSPTKFPNYDAIKRSAIAAAAKQCPEIVETNFATAADYNTALYTTISSVKSAKWFGYWVWRLGMAYAKQVLTGLAFADGLGGPQFNNNRIATSSVKFRDQIMRLAIHCGEAVYANRKYYSAGAVRRVANANATVDSWNVQYSQPVKSATPSIKKTHIQKLEDYKGGCWCVTTPSSNIIVRRRPPPNSDIVARPIIISNCVWTGNAIGGGNHRFFVMYCLCEIVSQLIVLYSTFVVVFSYAPEDLGLGSIYASPCVFFEYLFSQDMSVVTYFLVFYNTALLIFVSAVIMGQLWYASRNVTSNEVWFSARYKWMFKLGSRAYSFYDQGTLRNLYGFFWADDLCAVNYEMPKMSDYLRSASKEFAAKQKEAQEAQQRNKIDSKSPTSATMDMSSSADAAGGAVPPPPPQQQQGAFIPIANVSSPTGSPTQALAGALQGAPIQVQMQIAVTQELLGQLIRGASEPTFPAGVDFTVEERSRILSQVRMMHEKFKTIQAKNLREAQQAGKPSAAAAASDY